MHDAEKRVQPLLYWLKAVSFMDAGATIKSCVLDASVPSPYRHGSLQSVQPVLK